PTRSSGWWRWGLDRSRLDREHPDVVQAPLRFEPVGASPVSRLPSAMNFRRPASLVVGDEEASPSARKNYDRQGDRGPLLRRLEVEDGRLVRGELIYDAEELRAAMARAG